MKSLVVRIIFRGQEAAFGIGHLTEVVVHEFGKLPGRLDAICWSGRFRRSSIISRVS